MKETRIATGGARIEVQTENKAWRVIKTICKYLYMFRGVFISIPTAIVAIMLALRNSERLPESVAVEIFRFWKVDETAAATISRTSAVMIPLAITGVCILMTILSKRTVFPWLIGVFTLVLPILIWVTNLYPL